MKYIVFPIHPEDGKPDLEHVVVLPNKAEAGKVRKHLKEIGFIVILLPCYELKTYNKFKEHWEENAKENLIKSIKETKEKKK